MPWTPNPASSAAATRLAVTTTSAVVALPVGAGPDLRVLNTGAADCNIAFGGSGVVATAASMTLRAGAVPEIITAPLDATHVAAISAGTTTLEIVAGLGAA